MPDAGHGEDGVCGPPANDPHPRVANGVKPLVNADALSSSRWTIEPIAVTGIGLRLPGKIHDAPSFWKFLTGKGSGRCRVPPDRYNVDAFYGPGKSGHSCTEFGYFLDDVDLAAMDMSFWSIPRKEVELMDPQQRLMLEVVYECLESSGATDYKGKNVGCYVGIFGEDWADLQAKDTHNSGPYRISGYGDFSVSNRVSYELGFVGPSLTIRTACSSSLTALYEACQALYAGECPSAVVAGSNIVLSPHMTIAMTEQGVLSPTGTCKSFDASADGYARGEAVNAVHIKKLSDAIRDNDPIRAVIRAACINSDGRTAGLSLPNPQSHEALIRRSHEIAGITDLSQTAMVECHGTGTPVGDPIEANAVANIFGDWGILIGSVKSNLGHSEGASGLTGVIKMILALENKTIPPNIHFRTPNPKIPFKRARMRVPIECEPWPEGKAERVGVSSYGIGGANAHVLLESAQSVRVEHTSKGSEDERHPRLLVFSASHVETLRQNIDNIEQYVESHADSIRDLSYTLCCRRERFRHRAFAVASEDGGLDVSSFKKSSQSPGVVFVFTGQGAQYAQMGNHLFLHNAIFAGTIKKLDATLQSVDPSRPWTLEEELLRPEDESKLSAAQFSQPCNTAIQIALVDVLRSINVYPAAVVGHSSGEIAAAYACGGLSAAEAITVAYHRGQVSGKSEREANGGMLAIGLSRDAVLRYLTRGVTIGCENSPNSVTLTGETDVLDSAAQLIRKDNPDILIRRLRVKCAYHSSQMREVEEEYLSVMHSSAINNTARILTATFFSTVTGDKFIQGHILGPSYWCNNLTSPVLFSGAVSRILEELPPNSVFIEVGPHSALSGPLRQISQHVVRPMQYIPTLVRKTSAHDAILRTAGQLFQAGVPVDLLPFNPEGRVLTDLPTYAWHREGRYWAESRVMRGWRMREFPHHDLLGARITDGNGLEPTWRNVLRLEDVPWIRDHNILGQIVFPGAGYVAMAGESIRQLSGSSDFSLRNVNILTATVIGEDSPTELVTQFKPARLTTKLDSSWYDFTIASLTDSKWTKTCIGQARPGRDFAVNISKQEPGLRVVDPDKWYRAMKRLGLNYGTRFHRLEGIRASISEKSATAEVDDFAGPIESPYTMHPCTVDSILQLFSVAGCQGILRLLRHLAVPTSIEELYLCPPSSSIAVQASAQPMARGGFYGDAAGFCGDQMVFHLRNMRFSAITDEKDARGQDPHAGAQLVWKPAIDFMDVGSLIRPLREGEKDLFLIEELALTCIIETERRVQGKTSSQPHYERFREWLRLQALRAEQGLYAHVRQCSEIARMSSAARIRHVHQLLPKALRTEAKPAATAISRIFENAVDIFDDKVNPLELLLKDDLLPGLYNIGQLCDYGDFIRLLAHFKPNMRILEIGAGTGGMTATILPLLRSTHGERMYGSYTYTDLSAGFFVVAKEQFKNYDAIIYQVLDISADPLSQGFQRQSYDLVVASNVLHATPRIADSLQNVRTLLKPTGRLFLQELTPVTRWVNYVMGLLPGWWLGEADNRSGEPYISPEWWDLELRSSGFSGAEAVIHDGHLNVHIVSGPQRQLRSGGKRISILRQPNPSSMADSFQAYLHGKGFQLDVRFLGEKLPAGQTVVSLLDLEEQFIHSLSSDGFDQFKSLVFSELVGCPSTLWVTRPCQLACTDPRYAMILGLARTIRTELAMDFATLELDSLDESAWSAGAKVIEQLMDRYPDEVLHPVTEYVYSSGTLLVGQFYPTNVGEELLDKEQQSTSIRQLEIGKRGFLQTLAWKQVTVQPPVDDDWVEVEPRAIGLNFRDVLTAMGMVEAKELGVECSGIVKRIGPHVKALAPGDHVMVFSAGTFSSLLVTKEQLCAKVARELSFVEAATMPCVFATVIHSLMDIARLREGDTVLIHSACGGIGLAAIQICRMVGAKIYCTVGSGPKVEYLQSKLGIPREHIFTSRDNTFLRDVLAITNGKGVDVVLNSLSGELLHASWRCVAEFGVMVEIGKRDFIGKASLAMDAFESNRSFAGVDFTRICAQRPEITQGLLERCMGYFRQEHISPLPVKVFEAANVEHAFRYMQKGTHIGKVVVTMPESGTMLSSFPTVRQPRFQSEGCHIIVGGLGGLGRSVSAWMAMHGAKHFVFFSRSTGKKKNPDHEAFIPELTAKNCRVDLVAGDVSSADDVDSLIKNLDSDVSGVMQASMVLKDVSLSNMTFDDWQTVVSPKVQGTWNIHNALEKYQKTPDYFVLFSSFSGLTGLWGQANYAAANTFLDAFVQYRHSVGLPCSVLDIGVMEDVGYVSRNEPLLEHFRSIATNTLQEQDLLDAVQLTIDRSRPPAWAAEDSNATTYTNPCQLALGLRSTLPLSLPSNRVVWKRDPRMAIYHNLSSSSNIATGNTKEDEPLKRFLREASMKPAILKLPSTAKFLAEEIGRILFGFMLRDPADIDYDVSLPALGADSLIAIELRNWFTLKLDSDVTVLEILGGASLTQLGQRAANDLASKKAGLASSATDVSANTASTVC